LLFDKTLEKLASEIVNGRRLKKEELLSLTKNNIDIYDLIFFAGKICRAFKGNKVQLCSIVSAKSGKCSENCRFCAQSSHYETESITYPLKDSDALLNASKDSGTAEARHFGLVTSGKSLGKSSDFSSVCQTVKEIKSQGHILPCASLGTLSKEGAASLKEAGLTRYHHNLETSPAFFPNICTTHTFEERLKTLENVKSAGMETCSGGIFGLGESWEDRVDLAVILADIGVNSVPLNFLVPIAGTPMENQKPLPPMEILKIIALYRFALPDRDIKACGGRTTNLRDQQSWIFMAGANGMMVGNYLTTAGREARTDLEMLKDLDLIPVSEDIFQS